MTAASSLLVTGVAELVTNDPTAGDGPLGVLADAALLAEDGRVAWVGPASRVPEGAGVAHVDVGGRAVIPGFVDSHTHLVFAGDRVDEFVARMAGAEYSADGIRRTVAATRAATDAQLLANVRRLASEALSGGTTTIEVKSGYGLTVADESRSLRAAGAVTGDTTFLGAHVVPDEYVGRSDDYVSLVCGAMLAACAPSARFIDVFCERGAFDADQAAAVLDAGRRAGLVGRVHANQLEPGPGVRVAVEAGAASADHCTHLSAADRERLASSTTVATLLPGAEFSTRSPYADGRTLVDAGVTVALATDCNPGSSYTTSLGWCVALAVREMGLTTDEALGAATLGGARALRRDDVGHLGVGARADFVVLDAPTRHHLAYRPGVALVVATYLGGERVVPGPPAG